jgi:hypothetical protein
MKVNYTCFFVFLCVVYIFYPKPYIVLDKFQEMRNNMSEMLWDDHIAVRTAFLSYYISMYNTVNKEMESADAPVTVDEIYDFIQDIKHETHKQVPDIRKEDISFCFHLLHKSGICTA